jgi:hypothetical protein
VHGDNGGAPHEMRIATPAAQAGAWRPFGRTEGLIDSLTTAAAARQRMIDLSRSDQKTARYFNREIMPMTITITRTICFARPSSGSMLMR